MHGEHVGGGRELKRISAGEIDAAVEAYFNYFENHEDRRWFWLVWRCLDQSGKTLYFDEKGMFKVLQLVPLSSILFAEFLGCAGYPDLVNSLNRMLTQLRNDLDSSESVIDAGFTDIFESAIEVLGSDEFWQESWLALELGMLGYAVTTVEREKRYREALKRAMLNSYAESQTYGFVAQQSRTVRTLETVGLTM